MIELLISIGIFIVITGTVIMSFSRGKWRDELMSAGSAVQATVREAQTFTTAGATVRCPYLGPGEPDEPPPVGYGIYFEQPLNQPPVVVLFADCSTANTPYIYDTNPPGYDDVLVRQVKLPPNVTLTNFQPGGPLHIVFSPLIETVAVNGTPNHPGEAIVELSHAKSGRRMQIKVNAFTGQVFMGQPQ